jgi:hypothetical protein
MRSQTTQIRIHNPSHVIFLEYVYKKEVYKINIAIIQSQTNRRINKQTVANFSVNFVERSPRNAKVGVSMWAERKPK